MKVAIIGAGAVGSSLGKSLVNAGHEVMFSSRTPMSDRIQSLITSIGEQASAGTVSETLKYSDVVAIAMQPTEIPSMIQQAGDWVGKTVIDLNNVFGNIALNGHNSLAEYISQLTSAKVVKAFNTIGAEHYQDPTFDGQSATMFIAGDDEPAKLTVSTLASDLGFDVVDIGELDQAHRLESLAGLWVHLARSGHGRDIAFKLIRK